MNAPELKAEERFQAADQHLLADHKKFYHEKRFAEEEINQNSYISLLGNNLAIVSFIQHNRMREKGFYDSFYRTRDLLIDQAKQAHTEWQWKVNDIKADPVEVGMLKIIYEQMQSDLLQYTTNFLLKQKCLMHEEVAESSSALRENDKKDDKIDELGDAAELADTIIRIMDYAAFRGLNIGGALMSKMQYNLSRPKMHGKNA